MSPVATSRRIEAAVPRGQRRGVYLDYHASTPCDPRVIEEMLPLLLDDFANPASDIHFAGRRAAAAVETARERVAAAIRAEPEEIVFTSGATESNNLAILGPARARSFGRMRVLASAIEHKSVLEPSRRLRARGFVLEHVPVEPDGRVDLGALAELISEDTFLVSVQAVNNEIGTIQPILEVVQVAHAAGALVHCDAAQALGRIPVDVGDWGVDLLSLSGHKCYGPKGVGALYIRGGARRALLEPIIYGGGQEHNLRAGTLNVPSIVGFGLAAEIAEIERDADATRIRELRDWLEQQIMDAIPGVRVNGSRAQRVAGNSSLTFRGVEAEALIAGLRHVHVSTGSACTSGAPEPSHVLTALGLSREDAYNTVRIGLGRFTVAEDLTFAASRIVQWIRRSGVKSERCSSNSSPPRHRIVP